MAPPSTPDRIPPSTAFDEMVEIKVGSSKRKSFFMHKGVLCFYSGYFATAFSKDSWIESQDGVFDLDTEEIEYFEMFQYWCYTRRLSALDESLWVADKGWTEIIAFWLFGDRRDVPLLQNEVMNFLRNKVVVTWGLPAAPIAMMYSNTGPGSVLRKFVIDAVGKTSNPTIISARGLKEEWPKDALVDLVQTIWKPRVFAWSTHDLLALDMCQYHVHEEGAKCVPPQVAGAQRQAPNNDQAK